MRMNFSKQHPYHINQSLIELFSFFQILKNGHIRYLEKVSCLNCDKLWYGISGMHYYIRFIMKWCHLVSLLYMNWMPRNHLTSLNHVCPSASIWNKCGNYVSPRSFNVSFMVLAFRSWDAIDDAEITPGNGINIRFNHDKWNGEAEYHCKGETLSL